MNHFNFNSHLPLFIDEAAVFRCGLPAVPIAGGA
jgi:hypothetical protein